MSPARQAFKKAGRLRRATGFVAKQPLKHALRVTFMTAVGISTLVTLGMPLPTMEALGAVNSVSSLVTTLFPTVTKGIGLLGPHGGYVTAVSFMGGWTLAGFTFNALQAYRDGNVFGRQGFFYNSARTVLRVVAGTAGLLGGTYAGAKLATLFSKTAGAVHNTGEILKPLYTIKPTGLFTPPEVTNNFSLEALSRAGLENMQQGWSIFWQGIGNGVLTSDFAAAATVVLAAGLTTAAFINPNRAARTVSAPFRLRHA